MSVDLLKAHIRYQLQRHGWMAIVGLLLIVLALLLQLCWLDGLNAQNVSFRAALAVQGHKVAQKPLGNEDKRERQANFYASLPEATEAMQAIDVLNRAAVHQKVSLTTAEYRVARTGSGPLMRYQITVPLHAEYVALHAWLSEVMNSLPNVALDEISFKREDAGQLALDTRVRFTVYLRAP